MFAPSVGWGLRQLARDIGADLVVVGACDRRPIVRLLRGDNTRGAPSVPPAPWPWHRPATRSGDTRSRRSAWRTDGGPESEIALVAACVLAAQHGAALLAATAVWPTTATLAPVCRWPLAGARWAMRLDACEREVSERARALAGVDGRVLLGPPADELLAFGDDVDLLVVGARAHGQVRRLLPGSASASLARQASSPLLLLPHGRANSASPLEESDTRNKTVDARPAFGIYRGPSMTLRQGGRIEVRISAKVRRLRSRISPVR
jgi:nucleotide-binding universal stress UspA family protein